MLHSFNTAVHLQTLQLKRYGSPTVSA